MALTVSSDYFGELARKRARAEALRAAMGQASGQAIGALNDRAASDQAQANKDREALRLAQAHDDAQAQQALESERAQTQDRLALRIANERTHTNYEEGARAAQEQRDRQALRVAENARAEAAGGRAAEAHTTEQAAAQQAMATASAKAAADAKALADRERREKIVTELEALGVEPANEGYTAIAQRTGATETEVRAAYTALARQREADALKAREGEARVSATKAGAARDYAAAAAAKGHGDAPPLGKAAMSDAQKRKNAAGESIVIARKLRELLQRPELKGYTGPLDGVENYLRTKTGMQERERSQLVSAIGRTSDAYRTAVTGAAASDAERKMLETRTAQLTDNLEGAIGKLDAWDEDSRAKYEYWASVENGTADPMGTGAADAPASSARAHADAFFGVE